MNEHDMVDEVHVLCVDDEPMVLQALALNLRRRFRVLTAQDGAEGLVLLERHPDITVVVSDMRMPRMNGLAFLREMRAFKPDVVRILLTGESDLETAVDAVNEAQVFRFLRKPCLPAVVVEAIEAGVRQFGSRRDAEDDRLGRTLHGSFRVLTEVLASSSPLVFGGAPRLRRLIRAVLKALDPEPGIQARDRWVIEIAAMVSRLGCIGVPGAVFERVRRGEALDAEACELLARITDISRGLLADIPRLEPVLELLAWQEQPPKAVRAGPIGARVLAVAMGFEARVARGESRQRALESLRHHAEDYDPRVLAALALSLEGFDEQAVVVALEDVKPGMIFAEDVRLPDGELLAIDGLEVTDSFAARARGLDPQLRAIPVAVIVY